MSKTYYKVVNSRLESVVSSHWSDWANYINWHGYIVQYKQDEWVYPNIPKTDLMVFENYKDARIFADGYHNSAIYRCKVKNPKKIGILKNPFFFFLSALGDAKTHIFLLFFLCQDKNVTNYSFLINDLLVCKQNISL